MSKRSPALEAKRSELIVLFLLMDGALSGYQIRSRIRDWKIERYLPVSPTTVYRTLERLAGQDFLSTTTRQNGRFPVSTVYSITTKGKRHYRQLILDEAVFTQTSYSLTVFLGLAHFLTPDERERLNRGWQTAARARIDELDILINDKTLGPGHTYGKAFAEWVLLDHERDMLMAESLWMEKYTGLIAKHYA